MAQFVLTLAMLLGASVSTTALKIALPDSVEKSEVIVGHLKAMVDAYVEKYDDEVTSFESADAAMEKVISEAMDEEAKESTVDERLKMKDEHDKKLQALAGF